MGVVSSKKSGVVGMDGFRFAAIGRNNWIVIEKSRCEIGGLVRIVFADGNAKARCDRLLAASAVRQEPFPPSTQTKRDASEMWVEIEKEASARERSTEHELHNHLCHFG
jgi:hypothetical protein